MGSSYIDDAYKELIYTHPDWQKTADEYEQKFAANLYHTDYVQAAARTALSRLSGMLMAYYNVRDKKEQLKTDEASALADIAESISGQKMEGREVLEEALLPQSDSSTGAGQIGNAKLTSIPLSAMGKELASVQNQINIYDVIQKDGNLREQMTMLFNGMFINGGKNKEQIAASRSLKNMLLNITEEDLGYMRMAGALAGDENVSEGQIRFDLLKEMGHYNSKEDLFGTYSMARDLKRGNDKLKGRGNAFGRWWAGVKRGFSAAFSSFFTRTERSSAERQGLGLSHYENLGLPLSDRERANSVKNGKLKWLEGQAYYKMKTPVTAEGLLQTAGPSGTTLRMLGAYKLLGASKMDLLYFRLALIAWMVTSKDHSLYEILKGSHNAGLVGKEDLSEASAMYRTVDPLSEEEIRESLAPDHRFPHETIYMKLLNETRAKRRSKYGENPLPIIGWIFDFDRIGNPTEEDYNAFNYDAAALGINIYTTSLYKIMNPSQKYGEFAGRWVMNHDDNIDSIKEKDREDPKIMDRMFDLARISARVAQDGLKEMGARESERQTIDEYDKLQAYADEDYAKSFGGNRAYRGIAFRGGKMPSGGEFTFSSLTSTSLSPIVASRFYKRDGKDDEGQVLLRIRLDGKGAVKISHMSKFSTEYEVLVPEGSRFRVTKPRQAAYLNKRNDKLYFETDMTEAQKEEMRVDHEKPKNRQMWVRYMTMEVEEIAGPGEARRERNNAGREKRMEARRRLLQNRQTV